MTVAVDLALSVFEQSEHSIPLLYGKISIGLNGVRSKYYEWSSWLLRCKYALSLCAILL